MDIRGYTIVLERRISRRSRLFLYISASTLAIFLFVSSAKGAIQYGGEGYQAPFAASSTQQVGNVINEVTSGSITDGSVDAGGFFSGIGRFFAGINTWLKEKAGIDFFAILKAIGHVFLVVIQFVVDLLKKVL